MPILPYLKWKYILELIILFILNMVVIKPNISLIFYDLLFSIYILVKQDLSFLKKQYVN